MQTYVTTKVASVLPLVISACRPQNNVGERNRRGTRTVIRVVSCSANFIRSAHLPYRLSRAFPPRRPILGLFFHSPSIDATVRRSRASLSERTTTGTQSWATYITCTLPFTTKKRIPRVDNSFAESDSINIDCGDLKSARCLYFHMSI